MLNTTWLTTYIKLVELGHFTRTAEALYMTQPGVSQHIKKLEQACGCDLLIRDGKEFDLTEQGQAVYEYAKQQQAFETELLSGLKEDDPNKGTCKIGCSGAMALKLYPRLTQIQGQFPELNFHMEVAPSRKILSDIKAGLLDVGIVAEQVDSQLFDAQVIGEETLCLVLPKAFRNQDLSPETLTQLGVIDHPDCRHYLAKYLAKSVDEPFAALETQQVPIHGYINQLHQILLPVSQGLGFTVLPQTAVEAFDKIDELYIYPAKSQLTETLSLVHKRRRPLAARFNHLLRCFN
ncbi:LysR family transcriptional regulator [Vibrio sp. SCSIO 43136]|uniref:LysR family transcriptional regulator n=1 Tax=Vibrio sp. SCSIO 43136 TaxID=2819101 RepID=UPI0020761E59|nr:LysR family transcriptional regulator [Vibrio sp. SCSIO 43136]USD67950.1 LysR family transcriptional regulator [Vibrio sp. SCSIO 43136]